MNGRLCVPSPYLTSALRTLALAVTCLVTATLNAADYSVTVACDHEDSLYRVGEQAQFRIEVRHSGKRLEAGNVSYRIDDYIAGRAKPHFPSGTIPLKDGIATVTVSSNQPCFLRCAATFTSAEERPFRDAVGIGFSPEKIGLSLPVPDDFDAFWSEQKKRLAAVPMKPTLALVEPSSDDVSCYDVQVPCVEPAPVSGYLAIPKDARPHTLPAILWVRRRGCPQFVVGQCRHGGPEKGCCRWTSMPMGCPIGKPNAFYQQQAQGPLKNYRLDGRENRDTVYFRAMYVRLVRAIDFLTSRPEWDGKIVAVIGHSQGGGQALVAGGLDPRVTIVASGVPALCDHSGRAAGRINGWPKLVPQREDGTPDPQILQTGRYIDAVNFATRCRAATIMSVGFVDGTCPPSTGYAAYNALPAEEKKILTRPRMGHAAPGDIQAAFLQWITKHVAAQKAAR